VKRSVGGGLGCKNRELSSAGSFQPAVLTQVQRMWVFGMDQHCGGGGVDGCDWEKAVHKFF